MQHRHHQDGAVTEVLDSLLTTGCDGRHEAEAADHESTAENQQDNGNRPANLRLTMGDKAAGNHND